jgi:hypothetical protein
MARKNGLASPYDDIVIKKSPNPAVAVMS